ncbi:MAG: 50S ribosomal protein L3 N(5)-glutamine methyltransferase [Gammaproteobacteria bacterium]
MKAKPMLLEEMVVEVADQLAGADLFFGHGTDNAFDEAAWLVLEAGGFDVGDPEPPWESVLDKRQIKNIQALLERRLTTRQPLAYLINRAWFAGHEFFIDERAIVPRSHIGEWIPDRFEPWLPAGEVKSILDLCTGSGCIAVALALAFPEAQVDASDLSTAALEVAAINARDHGVTDRVRLVEGDLFSALPDRRYDLIVCNPPYVSDVLMRALPDEYRFEPELAFSGGGQGLDFIDRLLREAVHHLNPNGMLIVEAGSAQPAVENAYPDLPFMWLMSESEEAVVFALTAAELARLA